MRTKKRITMTIFQEVSMEFEPLQGIGTLGLGDSSFEPADLVSNILGLYGLLRDESPEIILSRCNEQAVKNRKENNSSSIILTSTTILGSIISQIPNLFAKTGGKIITGISKGLKVIITKPEHTEEVAIMFKLEYEK